MNTAIAPTQNAMKKEESATTNRLKCLALLRLRSSAMGTASYGLTGEDECVELVTGLLRHHGNTTPFLFKPDKLHSS